MPFFCRWIPDGRPPQRRNDCPLCFHSSILVALFLPSVSNNFLIFLSATVCSVWQCPFSRRCTWPLAGWRVSSPVTSYMLCTSIRRLITSPVSYLAASPSALASATASLWCSAAESEQQQQVKCRWSVSSIKCPFKCIRSLRQRKESVFSTDDDDVEGDEQWRSLGRLQTTIIVFLFWFFIGKTKLLTSEMQMAND